MKALYSSGKVRIIALLILLVAITGAFFISGKVNFGQTKHTDIAGTPEAQAQNQKEQPSESIAITDGDTFGTLMNDYGIDANDTQAILTASKDVYDLTTVRAGKKIDLYRDEAGSLKKLWYGRVKLFPRRTTWNC
jgi:cell envelope opacity-associated protein A